MNVTVITGASSGFGAALAPLFAADGDAVALLARRLRSIEEQASRIVAAGGKALPVQCDVSNETSVKEAIAKCRNVLGPVTRLIANAGINEPTPPREVDAVVIEKIMRTNFLGAVYCIEAVLPEMRHAGKGHIVGISSLAGVRGLPGASGYCASKAALIAFLESLRIEFRGSGISFTTICPGYVKTDMTASNKSPMPFLMELDSAAKLMHQAIVKQKSSVSFPWQLATIVKMGRFMPDRLYDWSFTKTNLKA